MITINSQLDMTPGAIPVVIHRSQYDSDFSIVFTLFARTGNFTIASGTTARVRGTKKSGTGYSSDAMLSISAKTVTVYGDQQMTVAAGDNIFEIVLLNGTKELCSANFVLAVERAAMDKDTITDATVVPELEHLEEYTQQAAEQAARSASVYAESWAVGSTGTREGEDTNNAKYWSEQAQGAVSGVASFNGRTGAVVPAANDYTAAQIKRSDGTVESAIASVESVNTNQNTRLTTAESNITTLQNDKVDKTTPLLNFDDTATDPLTDDGALANALRNLEILDDVIPSGGGTLYLKKVITALLKEHEHVYYPLSNTTFPYLLYSTAIERVGRVASFKFAGAKNLPSKQWTDICTIPESFWPSMAMEQVYPLQANGAGTALLLSIQSSGVIRAYNYTDNSSGSISVSAAITYICKGS